MTNAKRCLITGATGFVGSHLTRKLVSEGWNVHILVRTTSSLDAMADIAKKLTIHQLTPPVSANSAPNADSVITAVAAAKPEIVFHLAAMFRAEHKPGEVAPMIDANVTFTTHLLEGMRLAGVKTMVNTGTSWQHYQDASYDPVCLYAATKQAAEDILTFYCNAYGIKAVTLKLFDTYGPGDTRNKLFTIFKRASESPTPIAFSSGEQLIDLVHIDDVVRAYIAAALEAVAEPAGRHQRYGVSSGAPLPLRELAAIYERLSVKKMNIAWGARAYRAREVMQTPQLAAPPHWKPVVRLEQALANIVTTP
jgi:nucleoside-diphosphate-sugar epimerase